MSLRRLPVQSLSKHQANLRAHVSLPTIRAGVTDRADPEPLAVTFKVAGQITSLSQTTLWKLAKQKRIRLVYPPGTRRTLIWYQSLKELLSPKPTEKPQPRRRGRPRKLPANEARS
jgi:hypothetical protein